MKYKILYSFQVFDELKRGNAVFVTDRCKQLVAYCGDMTVFALNTIIEEAEKDEKIGGNRYEFWTEE